MPDRQPAIIREAAESDLHPADCAALRRMHAVRPVWRGVSLAQDVIAFPGRSILHAGPPVGPAQVVEPIVNSAAMAILFEGWAKDVAAARDMLAYGEVKLLPAQDFRAMVPLAAVLSPNMAVQIVADATDPTNAAFSPLNGGMARAQRLGLSNPQVLTHLRWINGNLAAMLDIIADRDIPLIDIADAALADGDDCHSRTVAATRRLVHVIAPRLGGNTPERRFLDKASGFFLNLWMAAVKCIAAAGVDESSSVITALGGNGMECGVKLGGSGDRWHVAVAEPPVGNVLPSFTDADRLGAIGDSALVDAMGFGAMTPVSLSDPTRSPSPLAALLPVEHPAFFRSQINFGIPARAIVANATAPDIVLGILDRAGKGGRIGGGVYRPPLDLFAAAIATLSPTILAKERV